jgi:SOS-response transcriptional repressor LexA
MISAVAEKAGLSRQHLNKILSGKTGKSKHLPALAVALEVELEWLATGSHKAVLQHPLTHALKDEDAGDYRVPVIGSAAANHGAQVEGYEATGESLAIRPHWQAIRIQGDSGEPVVLRGQTVLVDSTVEVEEGRLVVAFTDDGPVLKRFVSVDERSGRMFLASVNHGKGSLVVDAENMPTPLVVVGVVFTDSVAR